MYAVQNFKTKKALKEAVKNGESVEVCDPQTEGRVFLEGPHFPKPHSWYASVTLKNGLVTSVK